VLGTVVSESWTLICTADQYEGLCVPPR
jgi:hypothetical protein